MSVMKSDLGTGTLTFIIGAVIAFEAYRIPAGIGDNFGSGAFPLALGIVIAVCGAGILFDTVRKIQSVGDPEHVQWRLVWTSFLLLFAYSYSLAWFGFLLATVILVPLLLILLGTRSLAGILISAVSVPATIILFFDLLLGVNLPTGTLFGG